MVIDDFGEHIQKDIVDLFTNLSHHLLITSFLVCQNIFPQARFMKNITLNTTHTLIFFGPRDGQQIRCLARQIDPLNWRYIVDAYEKAISVKRTYLWFDQDQDTPNLIRLRSNFLPDEWPPIVWLPKKKEYEE